MGGKWVLKKAEKIKCVRGEGAEDEKERGFLKHETESGGEIKACGQ